MKFRPGDSPTRSLIYINRSKIAKWLYKESYHAKGRNIKPKSVDEGAESASFSVGILAVTFEWNFRGGADATRMARKLAGPAKRAGR